MNKWIVIGGLLFMATVGLVATNKTRRMRVCFEQFQATPNYHVKARLIEQGKAMMTTKLLPYILESYRDERDIQFTVGMLGRCRSGIDNEILWETARTASNRQIRIICMAQLLSRGYYDVWGEITEEDIEMIAHSMPVHIVHWKQLLLTYSGQPRYVLRRDTFPERHKFKALFHECIEKYQAEITKRIMYETTDADRSTPIRFASGMTPGNTVSQP